MSHPMGAVIITPKPLPIPWEVVMEWADRADLDDDEREMLDTCVQAMDRVFDEIWTERNKVKA